MKLLVQSVMSACGVAFASAFLLTGCSANGYITASVQSVIGLDVSENPQTQVPHVRFGFIRNQLYYVPTGKVVVGGGPSGSASDTPRLVSDIDVEIQFLSSTKIREKFAVGYEAVQSPAAKAMFAPAGTTVVEYRESVHDLRMKLKRALANPNNTQKAREWLGAYLKKDPNSVDPEKFVNTETDPKVLQDLLQSLEP